MGFADMLIKMGIRYDTERGLRAAEKLMKFINTEARNMSTELGEEKGSFPNLAKPNSSTPISLSLRAIPV